MNEDSVLCIVLHPPFASYMEDLDEMYLRTAESVGILSDLLYDERYGTLVMPALGTTCYIPGPIERYARLKRRENVG